jgi:hypothetical protein
MDLGVSLGSAFYVGALALVAGAIAGVVPALQATGGLMQSGLRALSGGGGGLRLGKVWSTMIVVQEQAVAADRIPDRWTAQRAAAELRR